MSGTQRRRIPYLLSFPGILWLIAFFAIPLGTMLSVSLQEGTPETGFTFTGRWQTYLDVISAYDTQLIRSVLYGLIVTATTLTISYPMMYWIARHGGRRKNLYLLLILLPFFTPFLIRTISWRFVLADQGIFLGPLKDVGVLPDDFQVLSTAVAVVSGMIYNFFPFMALPLYVSLERMDPALIDAASDLYSSPSQVFWKVTLPLSLPGIFAGSLLTFIPAVGDFVDAELLGGPGTTMIGNVIRRLFEVTGDYPTGAALAALLIVGILIGVFSYAKALGTEELSG